MIVRVLLAAIVATALLGTALPVVEDARHDAARTATDRTANRVAGVIAALVRSGDPVPLRVPGGRRVLDVDLPRDASLVVGGGDDAIDGPETDVLTFRVPPATIGRVRVSVDLRVSGDGHVRPDDVGLTIRDHERILLRYRTVDGRPTVVVSRGGRR